MFLALHSFGIHPVPRGGYRVLIIPLLSIGTFLAAYEQKALARALHEPQFSHVKKQRIR